MEKCINLAIIFMLHELELIKIILITVLLSKLEDIKIITGQYNIATMEKVQTEKISPIELTLLTQWVCQWTHCTCFIQITVTIDIIPMVSETWEAEHSSNMQSLRVEAGIAQVQLF